MVYDIPSGDFDVRLRLLLQIVHDEDDTTDQFNLSIVAKSMNTLAPIVSCRQLFQGQSRSLLSSHILQVSDMEKTECVAMSVRAGCDKARRLFATCHSGIPSPRQIMTLAAQCPHAMTVTRVLPRSSYDFALPIVSLFNPMLEYISSCHRNMSQNDTEPRDASSESQDHDEFGV